MKPRIPQSNYIIILNAATKIAEKIGRDNISFTLVAKNLKISRTVLYTYFNTTKTLKNEILMYALNKENIIILIEALIFNKINKDDLTESIKEKIADYFFL